MQPRERQLHLRLHPGGPRHQARRIRRPPGQVVQQHGLPHPRLAADHQHPAVTGPHRIDEAVQHAQLAGPARQLCHAPWPPGVYVHRPSVSRSSYATSCWSAYRGEAEPGIRCPAQAAIADRDAGQGVHRRDRAAKDDAGSDAEPQEARRATAVDVKREVAAAPVSDVDQVEVFGQVLAWPSAAIPRRRSSGRPAPPPARLVPAPAQPSARVRRPCLRRARVWRAHGARQQQPRRRRQWHQPLPERFLSPVGRDRCARQPEPARQILGVTPRATSEQRAWKGLRQARHHLPRPAREGPAQRPRQRPPR
jgi:hypothetical protein